MAGGAAAAGAASSSQPVRVVLRLRPFLTSEADSAAAPCVSVIGGHPGSDVTVQLKDQRTGRSEYYKLDAFYGHEDRVRDIFDQEVSSVITCVFEGVNATVFACGATGSGKTYTMQGTEDLPGLIPLAVSNVLTRAGTLFSVEISYYEVYIGRCYDLIEPKDNAIMALDDQDGNLQLKGLAWVPVRSMEEFQEVYSKGEEQRQVTHTDLNDVSSRSYAVLSIRVNNDAVTGKLNLIDLAGNEDNRKTCNEGTRSSLFALANVISAHSTLPVSVELKVLFDSVVHTPAKNITRLSSQDAIKTIKKVVFPSSTPCEEDKFESPLSKALSPISSNMVTLKLQTDDDSECPPSLYPKTLIGACSIAGTISSATPLDKFNAHGSHLMESLIQHFLEFLNIASKEELQEVKGIGEKRAEYILELREDSPRPFKSLPDLKNLGLSSKQIQGIVLKTATGIFEQSLERSAALHAGYTSQHRRRIN